ncbi:disulfide oxidoreductase YuzD [Alkalibacillus flavidus]|uniref:Disulfide oxidoreductase YuzD n=1 Tax=Alkalibacillus flavidus TaxID=546021 RepID=A0ABV2KVR5_9BACI
MSKQVELVVYGAEVICASCVNLPSSKEQYDWLQAAISRKYGDDYVTYKYVDIFNPPNEQKYQQFAEQVVEDDMIYPVVLVEDEIVGEGNPRLKTVYQALENNGLTPIS